MKKNSEMTRLDAIRTILNNLKGDEFIVHANGAISRESFFCKDRERNFYLLGSMGLPAAVGLGIAINQSHQQVVVLDGDGNLLMGFGNLALVGALKPKNFVHFVLDNESYETTGKQPTISKQLDLVSVALACGYQTGHNAATVEELISVFSFLSDRMGPHFVRVSVSSDTVEQTSRIPYTAKEIKRRFKNTL